MGSDNVAILLRGRGKFPHPLPDRIDFQPQSSCSDLYQYLAQLTQLSIHQLRITIEVAVQNSSSSGVSTTSSTALPDSTLAVKNRAIIDKPGKGVVVIENVPTRSLADYKVASNTVLIVKNLGRQISWRTVFVIEYLGPILIHLALFYLRLTPYSLLASKDFRPSKLQILSLILVVGHFLKREYESIFIHRFSCATMPFHIVFKNSGHYWLLSGLLIGWFAYSPTGPISRLALSNGADSLFNGLALTGTLLTIVGEMGNLLSHLKLRALRAPDSAHRAIPRGFPLFNLITCPNYFFEVLSWVGITLVTRGWATALFTTVSTVQMALWAKKKERRYRSEFGSTYPRKRWVMIPGVY